MLNEKDHDEQMVDDLVAKLGEHFDSVQVFCTRYDSSGGGRTVTVNAGTGNWYARFGQVSEWVTKEREQQKEEIRRDDDA